MPLYMSSIFIPLLLLLFLSSYFLLAFTLRFSLGFFSYKFFPLWVSILCIFHVLTQLTLAGRLDHFRWLWGGWLSSLPLPPLSLACCCGPSDIVPRPRRVQRVYGGAPWGSNPSAESSISMKKHVGWRQKKKRRKKKKKYALPFPDMQLESTTALWEHSN